MTALVQVADISSIMFGLSGNETEALVSQSVMPAKKQLGTMEGAFTLLAGAKI